MRTTKYTIKQVIANPAHTGIENMRIVTVIIINPKKQRPMVARAYLTMMSSTLISFI